MSRYSSRTSSAVRRPNMTSSFEKPKTKASLWSMSVTSTSSATSLDSRVDSSRPPKPAPKTTTCTAIPPQAAAQAPLSGQLPSTPLPSSAGPSVGSGLQTVPKPSPCGPQSVPRRRDRVRLALLRFQPWGQVVPGGCRNRRGRCGQATSEVVSSTSWSASPSWRGPAGAPPSSPLWPLARLLGASGRGQLVLAAPDRSGWAAGRNGPGDSELGGLPTGEAS
jgi:hypothetical protein